MPLYEYKCNSCGQVFELIQRFSDAPITQHESCGGQVERLLSAPALVFKGSGFYITDYQKSGASSNAPGGGKNETGKSDSKSESKSDSKTESKRESKSTSGSDSGSSSSASTSTSSSVSTEKK